MRIRFMISMIALALLPFVANAGQTGYTRHGQTVVVYKDGKKVGDWPTEKVSEKSAEKRDPASEQNSKDTLYFTDDAPAAGKNVRCYSISRAVGLGTSEPVSCVRTDN
jgi:hypothetical protein